MLFGVPWPDAAPLPAPRVRSPPHRRAADGWVGVLPSPLGEASQTGWELPEPHGAGKLPKPGPMPAAEQGWGGGGRAERAGKMAVSVPWLLGLALHGAVFLCGIVCASALTVAQVPGGWEGARCPLGSCGAAREGAPSLPQSCRELFVVAVQGCGGKLERVGTLSTPSPSCSPRVTHKYATKQVVLASFLPPPPHCSMLLGPCSPWGSP